MQSFKLALQGGGAKLLTLISAADGLQKLVREEKITFDEVTGSSAGAIVGLIIALDLDIQKVRDHFLKPEIAKRFQEIKSPGWHKVIWALFNSKPILQEEVVRKLVFEIFKLANINEEKHTFKLRFPLSVTVTDIHNQEVDFVTLSGKSLREAVQCIVDSCSIPLIFRNHTDIKNADKADGGLFENFPTSKLVENYDPTHVIGLTFEKERPKKPFHETDNWSMVQYLDRIISTAINANISASLREIPEHNRIELPSDFATLDFPKALQIMVEDDKRHREISDKVQSQLLEIIEHVTKLDDQQKWVNKTQIPSNYEQMRVEAAKLLESRLIKNMEQRVFTYIELNSLCSESDPAYKNGFDSLYQKVVYQVPETGLDCIGIVISEYKNEAELAMYASIRAVDDDGRDVPIVVLPAKATDYTKGFKALNIFLNKKLLPNESRTLTLIQKELVKDQFSDISTKGWDYLEYSPAKDGRFSKANLAFGIPSEVQNLFYVEIATQKYSEDTEGATFTPGRPSNDTGWAQDVSSPGISILSVESTEPTDAGQFFTAKVCKKAKLT